MTPLPWAQNKIMYCQLALDFLSIFFTNAVTQNVKSTTSNVAVWFPWLWNPSMVLWILFIVVAFGSCCLADNQSFHCWLKGFIYSRVTSLKIQTHHAKVSFFRQLILVKYIFVHHFDILQTGFMLNGKNHRWENRKIHWVGIPSSIWLYEIGEAE